MSGWVCRDVISCLRCAGLAYWMVIGSPCAGYWDGYWRAYGLVSLVIGRLLAGDFCCILAADGLVILVIASLWDSYWMVIGSLWDSYCMVIGRAIIIGAYGYWM